MKRFFYQLPQIFFAIYARLYSVNACPIMKINRSYWLSVTGLLLSALCFGQSTIQGTISDAVTQERLIGATILVEGTTIGTTSDDQGEYVLKLESTSANLVVSYLGYESQRVAANDQNVMDIILDPSQSELSELVVTALNIQRASRDLGYAIQQVDGATLSEVKSPNFINNLTGRVAGVTINQGATGVGSSSRISIRGESSFTNNNPLFVVDGLPINNNTNFNISNEAAAGFQEVDFGNGAMEINQDDIGSVNVLKGPNAAALYGSRAANGVVIITTKSGAKYEGLGISFNSSFFIDRPFQLPEFQNQYGQGNSGEFTFVDGLGGGINDNITYSWGPELDNGIFVPQFDGPVALTDGRTVRGADVAVHGGLPITPTEFRSYPDNLKDFYETGTTSINNLSISSGFDKGDYRLSVTDLRSNSFIPGVNLDRQTVASRLNFNPSDKLKIGASIQYINTQSDNRPSGGYGSENINYSLVAWGPRSLDIAQLKNYWQPGLESIQQYSFNYTFFDNPYFILQENANSFSRNRLFGNLMAAYDFSPRLSVVLSSGMDYSDESRAFKRHYSTNRFSDGAYAEQDVFYRESNTNVLFNYNLSGGVVKSDFAIGGNRLDQESKSKQAQTLSLAQPGIFNFSNAASPVTIFQRSGKKRINSLYAFAKFSFKNMLYLDITGRNDWSSALATPISTKNTAFFYPSISASYVVSETINLPDFVSFAKMRASWAQVGNDTEPYQTTSAFVAGTPFNSQPTFTADNTLPNNQLLPEMTTGTELGLDLRLFDDRLRLDATYYNAVTENQIISFPISLTSGYTQRVVNGGSVRAHGVELVLGWNWTKNNSFKWNSLLNFSRNVSTVESLPSGADKITLGYSRVYDNANQTVWIQVEEGGRIGDMYGTGYVKNEKGEFIISDQGNFVADNNLQKIGNYNPDFIVGLSNQISFKNWELSFLFDWRQGGEIVSRTLSLAGVGGQLIETVNRPEAGIIAKGVVNVGSVENPQYEPNTQAISAERYYRQYYDRNHEENNVYDASYLKLKQFVLGYTFSNADDDNGWLGQGMSLSVSLIGMNLYAWSAIPHFDPDQLAVQGNQFVSGVENMSYPTARSLGLKLNFDF